MNPLFREAAEAARYGGVMGAMTVLFFGCFITWAWWAWSPRNRERMDEAARLPLTTGDDDA